MSDLVHGVEVLEIDTGVRPVATQRSSVIGLVGTARKGAVNSPVLITGRQNALDTFGAVGTLAEAFEAIYAQTGALVVAVNVLDPTDDTHAPTVTDEALGSGHSAGDVLTLAHSGLTAFTSLVKDKDGVPATLVEDTDYTLARDTGKITLLVDVAETLHATYDWADFDSVPVADITGTLVGGTGVYALLGAESLTGVAPRILIAPGAGHFTTGPVAITGVPGALLVVAERVRGVAIIEGPNTTAADANTAAGLVTGSRRRGYFVDPWVTTAAGLRPPSAYIAGLISKSDNERGFWWSPSNQVINGITGTSRAIDFTLGDPSSEADVLNGNHIATIVRKDGLRLWGNRSLEKVDSKWQFLSVVRIADLISESLLRAHLWAVDRNITATYVEEVTAGVRAYLRTLVAQEAILGGDCWADPELNTAANIQAGKVYFDFDFTPPYPAEKITFRSHLVEDYIETIFA